MEHVIAVILIVTLSYCLPWLDLVKVSFYPQGCSALDTVNIFIFSIAIECLFWPSTTLFPQYTYLHWQNKAEQCGSRSNAADVASDQDSHCLPAVLRNRWDKFYSQKVYRPMCYTHDKSNASTGSEMDLLKFWYKYGREGFRIFGVYTVICLFYFRDELKLGQDKK